MANTIINYLSLTGLQKYDANIKAFIDSKVESGVANSFKYVNLVDGELRFYTVNPITEDTAADFAIELPEQDLSHLMQLVKDATEGNVASFGANGQVVDSGIKASDIAVKSEVEAVQADVDALEAYVGTIPEDADATNIVAYVNEKAQEVLESATGGSSESAASVKLALDAYKAENDPKVAANTEAAANAQTAADDAQAHSEGVAADLAEAVETLEAADEAQVERIAALEGQIVGLSGAMHFKGIIEGDALPETTEGYANGDVVIFGNKEYVVNNGAFVEFGDVSAQAEAITELTGRMDSAESEIDTLQSDLDKAEEALAGKAEQSALESEVAAREALAEKVTVLEAIDHEAYVAADIALKSELQVEIAKKADASVVTDLDAAYKAADEALSGRIDTLEDASHTHENADVINAITAEKVAAWDASEENAKAYVDEKIEGVDLSGIATNASAITALQEKDATIEADIAALKEVEHVEIKESDIDALFA